MRRFTPLPIFLLAALTVAASVPAQSLGTDIFTGHTSGRIMRTTPGGGSTTLGPSFGYFINMLTMDTDNKSIVALDTLNRSVPQRLLRIDASQGVIVGTIYSGTPLTSLQSWLEVDQDGDFVVADRSHLFKVKRDGSSVTTLYHDSQGYFFSFTEDKNSGDWLIGDLTAKAVARLDRATLTRTTLIPIGVSPTGMMQDPHRAEVYISGGSTTFIAYHPGTHAVTTVVTGAGSANASALDRAPAQDGALLYAGMTTGQIVKFDRSGKNLGVVGNTGAGSCLGVIFDKSRNLGPELVKAPNHRWIRIHFPGDGGKSYILALSLTGCKPGIPLPDGRFIPLIPDKLTEATVKTILPPLLTGNIGVLNTTDRALVNMNLNSLGSAVKGLRVWAAAVSLDPKAPLGISQVSAPLLFVLD